MAKALSNEQIGVAEEAFVRYLRSQQIKYTKPRRAILRGALGLPVHFDAEQLLALLHQSPRAYPCCCRMRRFSPRVSP